jgi:WXG100 family type VII secretion target
VSLNRLDPAELNRIAGKFETERDAITGALAEFVTEVEAIRAKWLGRAGAGFQNVAGMWKQQQDDLVLVLTQTAASVRTAAGLSQSANEQAVSNVNIQLPL